MSEPPGALTPGTAATFGEVVRQTRALTGLRRAASQAKVSPSFWSDIEHGRRLPADTAERMLLAVGGDRQQWYRALDVARLSSSERIAIEREAASTAVPQVGIDVAILARTIDAHFEEFHGDTLTDGCEHGIAAEYERRVAEKAYMAAYDRSTDAALAAVGHFRPTAPTEESPQ